jgi:hypothetical protein
MAGKWIRARAAAMGGGSAESRVAAGTEEPSRPDALRADLSALDSQPERLREV